MRSLRNQHHRTTINLEKKTKSQHTTPSHGIMMQLTQMEKDRDPFSRHILPPLPSRSERASAALSFSWELAVITGVFLYPNLQRSRPDSSLLHAHGNISWRVARHQAAHKLINPTCLTTTCQALHQRRSGAAAKGQRVSNSRGAGA